MKRKIIMNEQQTKVVEKTKSSLGKALIVIIIILMFLLCLGLIGWQNYQLLNLQTTLQQTQTNLKQQSSIIQSNQSNLQHVMKLISHDTIGWALLETNYLIKLADINLTINDNVPLAIKLLQTADNRIAALTDPSLIPLRRALTNDINTLQSTPKVDVWGIILRIETLNNQIGQTAIISNSFTKPKEHIVKQTETKVAPKLSWRNLWQVSLQKLKNIFVIRHQKDVPQPLLSLEQQVYLRQKIQLLLEQAQWAVMHKQPKIYHLCLQNVNKLVNVYFAHNQQAVQNISQVVEELQKIDIKPATPNISASIRAIHEAQQQSFKGTMSS